MSERTFRAVVAAVLIGALVLAVLVVLTLMPRSATPEPTPAPTTTGQATAPAPTTSPAPTAALPWATAELTGVGTVAQGSESGSAFVLRVAELAADSIPDAPGSFRLTMIDAAGDSSIEFVGTPVVDAPGSLGLTTRLVTPNVLMVSIVASDAFNVEPITIEGLRIRASTTAAAGPVSLQLGEFTGSLAGGTANGDLPPIATVVAAP